jgi:hypothetical protein
MTRLAKWISFLLAVLFASTALAQYPGERARAIYSQAELDQMLAPIALYPDALLSQILMAATYPRDVAEAASWSRYQDGLRGEEAVRAAGARDWDPSVLSLVAFPQVLAMMDERREWTDRLGGAFLDQPDDVMDTVQELRRRADEAGTLRSSEELAVQRQGDDYVIESPTPDEVYVPYYDPRVAYGSWWWPDYAPVYWGPWPSFAPIIVGGGFFFGSFDWRHRYLRYASHRPWYFHGRDYRGGLRWTHGWDHRRPGTDGTWRTADRAPGGRNTDRNAAWRALDRGTNARYRNGALSPEARASLPPASTPQRQGFFASQPESVRGSAGAPQRNPVVRQASPRYGAEGVRPQGRAQREAAVPQYAAPQGTPQYRGVERAAPQRAQVPAAPYAQPAPQRAAPAPSREAPADRADSSVGRGQGGRMGRER